MAIQSNFPAIRPSLLLDFANSKRLDPRITFTRASTARYYDGSTVAKAEENLLLRSQDYSATWTVTNLTPVTGKTAPDGTSTATEFTAGAADGTLTQSVTAIAADYTFSVWIRRVTGTGNIDISAHSGGTWVTQTISGTWARYTVTQTLTAGARTPGIRVVTSGDVIEVWGAQLEQRSAVTAYTATTTAPITNYVPVLQTAQNGVPRFDHNPTTGESLGLLIEEQRTNIATYSDDFANAAWTKTRSSITSNTIIAPDGTLTGDKLIEDTTATNSHQVGWATTLTANTTYTMSVYAKAGERNFIALQTGSVANWSAQVLCFFNLSTGVVTANTGPAGTMTNVGNGWWRCTITATFGGSNATGGLNVALSETSANFFYTGDGYKGAYIWGAQIEAGAFLTSYIPTVAASATRQADAASMTGTNFSSWYDAAEGTMYADYRVSQIVANGNPAAISDGTGDNRMIIRGTDAAGNTSSIGVANAVTQWNATPGMTTVGGANRFAFAYKVNDIAIVRNASAAQTDTSALIPVVNRLNIGADGLAGVGTLNGTILKLAYYPLRLTNAQLQAITG